MQTNQKQYTTQQIKTYTLQPQKLKQEMTKYYLIVPQIQKITLQNLITHCNLTILETIRHYQQQYITEAQLQSIIDKIDALLYTAQDHLIPVQKVFTKINTEIWQEELHTKMNKIAIIPEEKKYASDDNRRYTTLYME